MTVACPVCSSPDVVPVVHGKPSSSLLEAADRGEVVLAGCVVGDEVPSHACRNCSARFALERS
jgi:hypothetical protein